MFLTHLGRPPSRDDHRHLDMAVSRREDRRRKNDTVTEIHQEAGHRQAEWGAARKYCYQREAPSLQALCGLMGKYGRPGSVRETVKAVVAGGDLQ